MSGSSSWPAPSVNGRGRSRHRRGAWAAAVVVGLLAAAAVATGIVTGSPAGTAPGAAGRVGAGGAPAARGAVAATAPARCNSGTCYVNVNVATLWVSPSYPRAIDAPALASPANPAAWVSRLTVAQKLWLVGKLETQALYGTRVIVTGHSGTAWTRVVVPSQPTNRNSRGYPGWVPTRQLTRTAPRAAATTAVVRAATVWLWNRWGSAGFSGSHVMQVSYDTRLPVVRATATYVLVSLIGGRQAALRPSAVVLHKAGTAWGATRARVVAEARKFTGLQYLWGGTSGYGYDCSGFTYSVYHAYGITLSRDADQQAVHGTAVARAALRPGDLVFFRGSPGGMISHVGLYVGNGNMINAPRTGVGVRVDPVSRYSYYAGARRYLSR